MSRLDEILDAFDTDDFFANRESIKKAKADLLAWHREEVEKLIPDYWRIPKGRENEDKFAYFDGYNTCIDDIRASLEVGDE